MKKLLFLIIGFIAWTTLMQPLPAQAGAFNPMRSCKWSITAACAALRNGSYTRGGITHKFVGRHPNGAMKVHVYVGNARVK
jgi:hypothetical protein